MPRARAGAGTVVLEDLVVFIKLLWESFWPNPEGKFTSPNLRKPPKFNSLELRRGGKSNTPPPRGGRGSGCSWQAVPDPCRCAVRGAEAWSREGLVRRELREREGLRGEESPEDLTPPLHLVNPQRHRKNPCVGLQARVGKEGATWRGCAPSPMRHLPTPTPGP